MSGLKGMFHLLDHLVILSRSAGSEEAAACQSEKGADVPIGIERL